MRINTLKSTGNSLVIHWQRGSSYLVPIEAPIKPG